MKPNLTWHNAQNSTEYTGSTVNNNIIILQHTVQRKYYRFDVILTVNRR